VAENIREVFTKAPWKEGYDVTIGTSERGEPASGVQIPKGFKYAGTLLLSCVALTGDGCRHALVVFGGVLGLEATVECAPELQIRDPADLFDHYVNTCIGQGSRTIRTEVTATGKLCTFPFDLTVYIVP
jgi:hypothetical protein